LICQFELNVRINICICYSFLKRQVKINREKFANAALKTKIESFWAFLPDDPQRGGVG